MERNQSDGEYIAHVLELRRTKRLHGAVEQRIVALCAELVPELHAVKEIQGLAGGRNDLMLFKFNGRKVVIEVFATATQVSRDLRILDATHADTKIAVIIDKIADPSVFERFLRENPQTNYPFVFVGELLRDEHASAGGLKLRELIVSDEISRFKRFFRELSVTAFQRFVRECEVEGVPVVTAEKLSRSAVTFVEVFVTVILRKLVAMGFHPGSLKALATWLSKEKGVDFALEKVALGFNVFLYTDLKENFGYYSDIELLDFLRIGPDERQPYVMLSTNAVVWEIADTLMKSKPRLSRELRIFAGPSQIHTTKHGRGVIVSLPRGVSSLEILPPTPARGQKPLSDEEIRGMVRVCGFPTAPGDREEEAGE